MPRQFSLWQLLIVVTLAGVACGLVANYPTRAILVGLTLTYFLPAIALSVVLAWLTSRPLAAWVMVLTGAVAGFTLASQNMWIWGDYAIGWWDLYPKFFLQVTTYTTVGAIAGAMLGALLAVTVLPRRRLPTGRRAVDSQHQ